MRSTGPKINEQNNFHIMMLSGPSHLQYWWSLQSIYFSSSETGSEALEDLSLSIEWTLSTGLRLSPPFSMFLWSQESVACTCYLPKRKCISFGRCFGFSLLWGKRLEDCVWIQLIESGKKAWNIGTIRPAWLICWSITMRCIIVGTWF